MKTDRVIFNIFPSHNYIDLDLYQCGREECIPGHVFGPARRQHYLFHYVLKGKGMLIACGSDGIDQRFEIYAGQGFLLFPGQMSTYMADESDPWTYEWLEFDGLRVKESLDTTVLSLDHPVYCAHTLEMRNEMAKEIDHIVMNCETITSTCAIGHLYLFFNAMIQSTRLINKKKTSRLADFYVKEAISFIEQHYQEPITVEDIAESLGIDRSYFGKLFRRIMGSSPQQFLIQYRLVKAAELLKATDLNIQTIARQVGYDNQLHFSRSFKQHYGSSPREWRREDTLQTIPIHFEQTMSDKSDQESETGS